jgi:chromosome segregation protein
MTDRGAHYSRCDFQIHTPRDPNWSGNRPVSDKDRQAWAEGFITACRSKGLGAVAITDHHDFVLVRYVRQAAERELGSDGKPLPKEQHLVVFPGLELTLDVPCQALLILDAEFPDDRLDAVLTRLAVPIVDAEQAKLGTVTSIKVALLSELHTELNKDEWLRGRYIVLPNVTDGGHQTLLRPHFHQKYSEMPCVGGYLDGTVETKVGTGNRNIFDGLNSKYGNKKIALIQTSDSRSATYVDLGKHSTWIKWSVPTAEALRQACLAQESRISQVKPELPTIWVSRISVGNSTFLGPIELELNSQFNAFIGGRGTGKSTLLEYLRWALFDQPATATVEEEIGDPATRQKKLIASTLEPTDSTVEVHFTINELQHVVRRKAKTGEVVLKVGDAEFVKAREADIRELLPVQAYSQKQLSSVSLRIEELTRFVQSPIRRQLAAVDQQIGEAAARVRENYATLQRHRQLHNAIHRLELSEQSLSDQAANLRSSLEDVSEADRAILEHKPKYDSAQSLAESWSATAAQGLTGGERLSDSISSLANSIQVPENIPEGVEQQLSQFRTITAGALSKFRDSIAAALDSLRSELASGSEHERLYQEIQQLIADFNATYVTVKDRSTAHTTKLKELAEVERQFQSAGQTLRTQRTELQALGQPDVEHARLLHQMFDLMSSRSDIVAAQCTALSELSGGILRATLRRAQGLTSIADRFRTAVSGSGLRRDRIDGFFEQLSSEGNPLATWEAAVSELEGLTVIENDAPLTSEQIPVLARLGMPVADMKKVATKINGDSWLALALGPVADHPLFEYQTKENEYIEFSSASAGQQATALLTVLLAQPGPPLIIDQPEDDLDSEVVVQVVEQIWAAKRHRQLIFTSHNANLVVNGDAELVIHCDYRVQGEQSRGQIAGQGAIDLPTIREAIVRVMDGGEKAFRLRADKYGF